MMKLPINRSLLILLYKLPQTHRQIPCSFIIDLMDVNSSKLYPFFLISLLIYTMNFAYYFHNSFSSFTYFSYHSFNSYFSKIPASVFKQTLQVMSNKVTMHTRIYTYKRMTAPFNSLPLVYPYTNR